MARRCDPVQIERDPFARTTLTRQTVPADGETCAWCGGVRPNARLYAFVTEHDGGRKAAHRGRFCSRSCHDAYHGTPPPGRRSR
jgi:hypothetical protein